MTYREAESLRTLLAEVNAYAPSRDKASDGWIGDVAHASRDSDHNPWVKDPRGVGVVRARDFDDDPPTFSADALANHVVKLLGKHPALGSGAYVIRNRRIISTDRLREGWRPYFGINAHKLHVHISVGVKGYDSTKSWGWKRKLTRGKRIDSMIALGQKSLASAVKNGKVERAKVIRSVIARLRTLKEK